MGKGSSQINQVANNKQQNENKEIVMDQSKKLDNPTDMDDRSELCFPGDLHIK